MSFGQRTSSTQPRIALSGDSQSWTELSEAQISIEWVEEPIDWSSGKSLVNEIRKVKESTENLNREYFCLREKSDYQKAGLKRSNADYENFSKDEETLDQLINLRKWVNSLKKFVKEENDFFPHYKLSTKIAFPHKNSFLLMLPFFFKIWETSFVIYSSNIFSRFCKPV